MKRKIKMNWNQSERFVQAMIAACEFGYKQAERGVNLQAAIKSFVSVVGTAAQQKEKDSNGV